ncbi:hypothetical protein ACIRRA_36330 [Nocardia sp. NPDC101769]
MVLSQFDSTFVRERRHEDSGRDQRLVARTALTTQWYARKTDTPP